MERRASSSSSNASHVGATQAILSRTETHQDVGRGGKRMAESGQTPTSKRLGPVDHTCQRKSCCEPNLRAMSQVETQTLLIGLSL